MNDPSAQPIDIEEQRRWLIDHKANSGMSWAELGAQFDIKSGTLSQFGSEKGYAGDEERLAMIIFRHRQRIAAQAKLTIEAPEIPGYFETETSKALENMLMWAARGRIVVAALGPGLGKTMTAKHFRECFPNVFMATMSPSTAGVNNMQVEVLDAMGEKDATGTPQRLTHRIKARVRDMANPVLIIDEAQHLSEKAIEEIRGWNDSTGLGIALFGNIGVMQRLEGGSRKAAFAQLYSRVALKMTRPLPTAADARALAEAWQIDDPRTVGFIQRIALVPGGLRGATMALELASMLAVSDNSQLALDHLQDAWAQLSSRSVLA